MNYEAWKKRWKWQRLQRERAASTPGEPVPFTGKRGRRGHAKQHKIPLYSRPRAGGGRRKGDYDGWRQGHTGPLE